VIGAGASPQTFQAPAGNLYMTSFAMTMKTLTGTGTAKAYLFPWVADATSGASLIPEISVTLPSSSSYTDVTITFDPVLLTVGQ
jgi:hypothetical protein